MEMEAERHRRLWARIRIRGRDIINLVATDMEATDKMAMVDRLLVEDRGRGFVQVRAV